MPRSISPHSMPKSTIGTACRTKGQNTGRPVQRIFSPGSVTASNSGGSLGSCSIGNAPAIAEWDDPARSLVPTALRFGKRPAERRPLGRPDDRASEALLVFALDVLARVVLHHCGRDECDDGTDENVNSDRVAGLVVLV